MKSSRNLKVGVTLLVIALAVGVFAFVVWADGNGTNGTYGMRGGAGGNIESPRYGMQNKGVSNQGQNQDQDCEGCVEGLGNGMGRRIAAPDDDGDGIPNGQDSDYIQHNCDEECDGTCDSEPKGSGMGRNSSNNISGLQAHISGMEMKTMTIADIAALWGVDADELLEGIKNGFELTQMYNIGSTIDDLRGEYRFSPYQIMEIAQRIKTAATVE
jgi:hypothetical protein